MERLTQVKYIGRRQIIHCNAGNDIALKKLATYEDEEELGLLMRLPCKVGDTIYKPWFESKNIEEYKIYEIKIRRNETIIKARHWKSYCDQSEVLVWTWQINKKVFLTREEAEAALMY